MTCIIGLVEKNKVFIGADSACISGWNIAECDKLFQHGELLFGYSGLLRDLQIIKYGVDFPLQVTDQDDFGYIVGVVANTIRITLKNNGAAVVTDNQERSESGCIIGYKGNLYTIDSSYSVLQSKDSLCAIGCGAEYALGAMSALEGVPPKKRIRQALKIASRYSVGVSAPFNVKVI